MGQLGNDRAQFYNCNAILKIRPFIIVLLPM